MPLGSFHGKKKQFPGEVIRRTIAIHRGYNDCRSDGRCKRVQYAVRRSCRCSGKYVLRAGSSDQEIAYVQNS
jgi:hypothetical protein